MTRTIENTVIINRPIDEVFAFVTDPATTPQWQANLVRSEILSDGLMGVGTRIKETRRLGKSENQAIWEITEYEVPTRRNYVYPQGFGPVRQRGGTTFELVEGGTRLHFTAFIDAAFPFNLLLPFLARVMRAQNDKSFAVLKQVLEAEKDQSQYV